MLWTSSLTHVTPWKCPSENDEGNVRCLVHYSCTALWCQARAAWLYALLVTWWLQTRLISRQSLHWDGRLIWSCWSLSKVSARLRSSIARVLVVFRQIWRRCFAMLVETFLSADFRVPEVGVPVPSPVANGIPLLHVSVIASSSETIADHQGVATLFPDEIDAEQGNAEKQSEEDEIVGCVATSATAVCRFGVVA